MNSNIDDDLSILFDHLADRVPVEPVPPFPGELERRRRPRRWLLPAAALVLVAAGGTAVVQLRDGEERSPSASTATLPAGPDAPALPPLFDEVATPIEWRVISPESSIGEAQIGSIAAGPGGFVATGLGFDDFSDGQGRVWFSSDGVNWTEPAHDLFAPQGVGNVVATPDAYWLYATPTPPTEGSPPEPSQLYRSNNGTDWSPVGEQTDHSANLLAIDDVLLQAGDDGGIATSTDGLTWSPALLDTRSVSSEPAYFDDRLAEVDGTFYIRSWTATGTWAMWSTTTGTSWTELPTPQTPGRLTGTDTALLSVGAADETTCNVALDDVDADPGQMVADQWACNVHPTIEQFAAEQAVWSPLGTGMGIVTPTLPGVAEFGNQLIAVVQDPAGPVRVWTSPNGISWEPTNLAVDRHGDPAGRGSPAVHWLSVQTDSMIIIPISSNGVGTASHLIIGTVAAHTDPG